MKKRIKLFVTLAVLCFSVAMLAFGVFSALSVTYKTKGVISYDIENTYVEIETRIYSTSKKFDDDASLKTQAQIYESSNFEQLDSYVSTGIIEGETTHTFKKEQLKNLDKGKDYVPVDSDFVDTYSSVASSEDPKPLNVALKYSSAKEDDKGTYTFIVVTRIKNKSSIPLYAYVPKTGEDAYVAPENSSTYKQIGYQTLKTLNSEVYVVFAMSLKDITKAIDEAKFTFPIKVSLDMKVVTEDIADEMQGPSIIVGEQSYAMVETESIIPTTPSDDAKLTISSMDIDMATQTATTYIDLDFATSAANNLYRANVQNSGTQNLTLSFSITATCPPEGITEEISLYQLMSMLEGEEMTLEDFTAMCQQLIPLSFKVMDKKSTDKTAVELTAEDGIVWDITVDETTFVETCVVTIPRNLLSDDGFALMIYGNNSQAILGLYAAIVTMNGGYFALNNICASEELSTLSKPEAKFSAQAAVDNPYAYTRFSLKNIPEEVNAVVLTVTATTSVEIGGIVCVGGTEYRNVSEEDIISYAAQGKNILTLPRSQLTYDEYTLFIIFTQYLEEQTVQMNVTVTYGDEEMYNAGLDSDENGEFYNLYDVSDALIINGVLEIPSEIDGIPVKKLYLPTKTNVTELIIPDVCRYAYEWVFANWTNLKKVTIYNYDGRMAFDMNAFNNCENLETIVFIGAGCEFYYQPFVNCPNLRELIYEGLFVNTSGLISGYLIVGGVVKVKCNSLAEVTNETLTNTELFTATYDSATGYAIFTKK